MRANGLTDYEMQLVLEKKGHKLYFPELDNQVDNEELAKLAVEHGYQWNEEKELWFKIRGDNIDTQLQP